jgi:hypothetical protein
MAHKLSQELGQTITSERQVVYILVELRKLLEKKGLLKEERFRALRFCCDWTVHSRLDRDTAKIITELFDRYETLYRQEPIGVSQAGIPELVEFCEHSRFRQQFITACQAVDIATDTICNDDWWREFLAQFLEVVRDIRVEAKPRATKYVKWVTASVIDPQSVGIFNKQFVIFWMWKCHDRDAPGSVVSLF